MAMIHAHRSRLPVARALLYEEAVEMLLWHWERIKIGGFEEAWLLKLLHQANRTEVDLRKMLWELAYQVHGSAGGIDETVTDIREKQLMTALVALTPNKRDLNWARDVVDQMRERAGVLVERETGLFAFPHRTFQEYLAGAHLSAQANFAKQATELFRNAPIWREVILLAVGRLVHISIDLDKPLALVAELTATEVDDDMASRQVWLAGDVLLEMGKVRAADSDLGKLLLKRVDKKLEDLVSQGKLSDAERNLVAQTRAELIAA